MKVLYIITQADGGGAQQYVLSLAKHFNGAIAAGNEDQKLFDDAQALGLTVFPLRHLKRNISPLHDLLAIWEIRQLVKFYQPDIVHLNSTKAGILGSFACIRLKTRAVFTAHGFIFNEPMATATRMFYLALEKTASDFRDFIITVSEADYKSAIHYKLIAPNKIATVHNGIPPINFLDKLTARQALNLLSDKFLFVTIANFYKTKGIDMLIKAVAMMDKNLLDRCLFILIGEGPEKRNLKFEIRNLQLENHIKTLGKIDNASQYLRAFDCFVLPSRKEGFPFVILEAMQAGLPIIATNVGGIKEALGDAGILVPLENPAELAKTIATIIHSCMIVEELSLKSKERAKLFTEEKMLKETEKIYRTILA